MEVYKVFSRFPTETKYYIVHKGTWYKCTNIGGRKRVSFASDPKKRAVVLEWEVPEIILSSPLELLIVMNLSQGQVIEWIEYMESIRFPGSILREGSESETI